MYFLIQQECRCLRARFQGNVVYNSSNCFCFHKNKALQKYFSLWLYALQPGTVSNRLNARQSKFFTKFSQRAFLKPHETVV